MTRDEMPGLYVHVPFCRAKCPYCHFYSVTSLSAVPDWLHALETEAQLYRDRFNAFDTIYLGGGTPSLLDATALTRVMEIIDRHFAVTSAAEITIEANPGDITSERLTLFKRLGITRVSVGVQSFHDRELQILGRGHTAVQSERSLEILQDLRLERGSSSEKAEIFLQIRVIEPCFGLSTGMRICGFTFHSDGNGYDNSHPSFIICRT